MVSVIRTRVLPGKIENSGHTQQVVKGKIDSTRPNEKRVKEMAEIPVRVYKKKSCFIQKLMS